MWITLLLIILKYDILTLNIDTCKLKIYQMELLLHASKETFYRFMPCKRCKTTSRHSVNFKNVYFNTASETEEVIYIVCCMNCKQVFKKEFIEITKSATYKEWNLLIEKGVVPS